MTAVGEACVVLRAYYRKRGFIQPTSNVLFVSVDVNWNVAVFNVIVPLGPDVMLVSGALLSILYT